MTMPVMVRNLKDGPTVFSIPEKRIEIEWQGKGDPTGADVQGVPDEVLESTYFQRALRRGVFETITDLAAEDALNQQNDSFAAREAVERANSVAAIDPEAHNDILSLPCQGPSGRGSGLCTQPVAVKESKVDEAPVLCPQHDSLASEFVQSETGQMKDTGSSLEPVKVWTRVILGARERAK